MGAGSECVCSSPGIGLALQADGYTPSIVDAARPAPALPDGVTVEVFHGEDDGTLTVRVEGAESESSSLDHIGIDDDRNCTGWLTIPGNTLGRVLSDTADCEARLSALAAAIVESPDDWRSAVAHSLPSCIRCSAVHRGGPSPASTCPWSHGVDDASQVLLLASPTTHLRPRRPAAETRLTDRRRALNALRPG